MNLKLVKKITEAKGTKSFYWISDKKISYLPGQYYYYTLPVIKYPDSRGNTRHFTVSQSPTENDMLRLTTRIRPESGYKKSLDVLAIGSVIQAEGPSGTFILDENEPGNHVLLAGGIGITPFRSFIKYNIDKNLTNSKLYLIYSNSIPEEIAFRNELEEWRKKFNNIKIEIIVTKPQESKVKWTGLTGRIDKDIIKKLIGNWKLEIGNLNFWLSGPPGFVDAMEKNLKKVKADEEKIRSDKFTGY